MEDQAQAVLQALKRSTTSADVKLAKFNELKSNIKHQRVPDGAQAAIFECIKLTIGSQTSTALIASGFSSLGHLIKRLSLQNQSAAISQHARVLFAVILDRLGDARESHRNAASQTLSDLWQYCPLDVERIIRDNALPGTNARAKEMGMQWVVKMSKDGLAFKTFVPKIVANLEDADGAVRDVAKHSVVELFRDAPEHAKSDLKKQLSKFQVRSSIASHIISQLGISGGHAEGDLHSSTASVSTAHTTNTAHSTHTAHSNSAYNHLQPDTGIADSALSISTASEAPTSGDSVHIEPSYVHSVRELEEIFRLMGPHFEGKESEGNWMARDKSVMKIRQLNKGNAPSEFLQVFLAGVKGQTDGILKVVNSLRTTMSTNGCQCIQELARTLGPAMDNMTEILLQSLIKMSAATKKIAASNANTTVEVVFQNMSYSNRILQHISFACHDKNVQPREYASGWLKTLIKKHAPHRSTIEHSGGLEIIEKCLKKGLEDPIPKVREGMRATFWAFAPVWPERADILKDTLEKKHRDALERDPGNPNGPPPSSTSTFSKSLNTSTSRPNIRDAIAQQRRAAREALKAPARPNSAQSSFSPVKQSTTQTNRAPSSLSNSRSARTISTTSGSSTTTRPVSRLQNTASTPGGNGNSGLMSAPMRRPRRPELARPATADPYASRRIKDATTATMSPSGTPQRETVEKSVAPKSTVRPRTPGNVNRPSPSSSPSKVKAKVDSGLRRKTPALPDSPPNTRGSPMSSPSKVNEEMTMVLPYGKGPPASVARKRMEKPVSMDTGIAHADEFAALKSDKLNSGSRSQTPQLKPSPAKGPYSHIDFGSPASSSRSPRIRSPERNLDREQEEVVVYEDPFVSDNADAPKKEDEKPVLEELQLNEANVERRNSESGDVSMTYLGESINGDGSSRVKPAVTEQDRADAMRSRRLLISGIERIQSRNLDAHGFRRLQELVKSTHDIWGDNKFQDLLHGLLDFLETPLEDLKTSPSKAQNLKTQALATTRAMITLHRAEARPHYARALKAVLRARMGFDTTAHISSELERMADDIVRAGLSSDLLDAVLDLADSLAGSSTPSPPTTAGAGENAPPSTANEAQTKSLSPSEVPSRAITASLAVLSQMLVLASQVVRPRSPTKSSSPSKPSPSKSHPRLTLSPAHTQRLGRTAVRFLADAEPDVRKADLEFCVALHEWIVEGGTGVSGLSGAGKEEREEVFWKILGLGDTERGEGGVREQSLNLITYYLARRGRVVGGD